MNYTEWLASLASPLYEADGVPQCPPGYKFNKKTLRCEPKSKKDDVMKNDSKDNKPENGPSFNVIGSHGMNGAPYAYEEKEGSTYTEMLEPDFDRDDKEAKKFAKDDARMKYGKSGQESSLRPGEVRKPNRRGGYSSNKKD